ncbi:MAG TPA: glycosyltransferase [Isosphaeraceae bacterium]|jgi:hypothetical protein|nr:glycosyltransferase [Isosphaeraceae bacterium]
MLMDDVDVILIRRDDSPPPAAVARALAAQRGVRPRLHRVVGAPRPDEPNRWATIARARNAGRRLGSSPWAFFLDDDVVLEPDCLATLVDGLRRRPEFAALAADYLGESRRDGFVADDVAIPRHVAAGAILFRREVLAFVPFRWQVDKCECQCCCDDLRRAGFGIGYLRGAGARHEPSLTADHRHHGAAAGAATAPTTSVPALPGRVLAAFDRAHMTKFRKVFLATLRASGNAEPVTAVVYGATPSEVNLLAMLPGVAVVALPANGVKTPIRRLRDFPRLLARWPAHTPVAYWDAGDVWFQGRLDPLWAIARAHPDRLLAAREPASHPVNWAVAMWTESIADPAARAHAVGLLTTHPFLNSGFAAGTAGALVRYFEEADRLRHSPALYGTSDWGDQTALNLYCHADPSRWHEVSDAWNYCLYFRPRDAYRALPDGRLAATNGQAVVAVHGNGRSSRRTELAVVY